MTPATLITKDATLDDLSASEYRDIWDELRQVGSDKPRSYDKCIELLGSGPSKPRWQQFEKGEAGLSREMRNALRGYVGLPLLPPTVAEATAQASPDAAVWQIGIVGETGPDTVIMVTDSEPLWIHVNGDGVTVQDSPVSGVTRPQVARKYIPRPYASKSQYERLQRLGLTWGEVIEVGLKEFEV